MLVSFPFGLTCDVSSQLVSAPVTVYYLAENESEINYFEHIFSHQAFLSLLIIAENDVHYKVLCKSLKMVKINNKLKFF